MVLRIVSLLLWELRTRLALHVFHSLVWEQEETNWFGANALPSSMRISVLLGRGFRDRSASDCVYDCSFGIVHALASLYMRVAFLRSPYRIRCACDRLLIPNFGRCLVRDSVFVYAVRTLYTMSKWVLFVKLKLWIKTRFLHRSGFYAHGLCKCEESVHYPLCLRLSDSYQESFLTY